MARGKIIEWDEFLMNNPWAAHHDYSNNQVPSNCVAVYYVVSKEKDEIVERLCMTTWDAKYKEDFKTLSLAWVEEHFEVEQTDLIQVETPEQVILQPGGEVFFLLNSTGVVVGVVANLIHQGVCELVKMTVRKEYTGRGYAHILMREAIRWAKEKNYPFIELLSNIKLENAISIYKKYGFETTLLGPHPDYVRCNIGMRLTF